MSYLPLIIAIVSGVVGGNVLGAAVKNLNLGPVGNSIAGLLGGGIGGQLLNGRRNRSRKHRWWSRWRWSADRRFSGHQAAACQADVVLFAPGTWA